ncbi:MAG: alkaline phosphatase D [Verrucomicrobiales bacterium]
MPNLPVRRFTRRDLLVVGTGVVVAGCTSRSTITERPPHAEELVGSTLPPGASSTSSASSTPAVAQPTLVGSPTYQGAEPFALGVASGDPDATSVVLWTRLLTSFDASGPFADADLGVAVDVAADDGFDQLVHSSVFEAPLEFDHSVHAIVEGLDADSWYWYRFRIGDQTSPIGRTRTMPNSGSELVRFGFSSCQNWESGAYAAHRHLAEADLDFFVWLGDYIYEYGPANGGVVASAGQRIHNSAEVDTLEGYRRRYAQYKSDAALQAHHAARPWLVTWDDHEVDNNHAGLNSEDGQDRDAFAERRRAAHRAWWENMPVRLDPPDGDNFRIYRTSRWGDLVDLHMLDGRQYRAPQPTDGDPVVLPGVGDLGVKLLGQTALDPEHSMLGSVQRAWLEDQLESSTATWNVLGNQVYMHGLNAFPGPTPATNTDTWDGYFGERKALLERVAGAGDRNLIILSGDFHAASAGDVRADPFDLNGPVLATEFMAPAISSTFPKTLRDLAPLVLAINPQIRHFSPENGFMTCEVTPSKWTTRLHLLADVANEASTLSPAATFTVDMGAAGVSSIT